jgi:hypothetical protein
MWKIKKDGFLFISERGSHIIRVQGQPPALYFIKCEELKIFIDFIRCVDEWLQEKNKKGVRKRKLKRQKDLSL